MRILLTANASYVPPRGGATRSNLIWLDQLAARGHECRIVCGASGRGRGTALPRIHRRLRGGGSGAPHSGAAPADPRVPARLGAGLVAKTWDTGCCARRSIPPPGRVVYLAHTPQFFPFGPASWNPDRQARTWWRRPPAWSRSAITWRSTSSARWAAPAAVIHPPIYGAGPFADYGNFDRGLITMINPCAVKGISIFLESRRGCRHIEFGVVPGWGTTSDDRRALRAPAQRPLPAQRAQHRRRAGADARAADAVAVVRRLRADRDGEHAARHSGGGQRFRRAGGGQARHRLRDSGAAPSSGTSRCSTSTPCRSRGARERCRAVGGGARANCSTTATAYERESAASRDGGRAVSSSGLDAATWSAT